MKQCHGRLVEYGISREICEGGEILVLVMKLKFRIPQSLHSSLNGVVVAQIGHA